MTVGGDMADAAASRWTEAFAVAAAVLLSGILLAFPGAALVLFVPVAAMLLAASVWIAIVDAQSFQIPDAALLVVASLGSTLRLGGTGLSASGMGAIAVDAALCGGALWLLREVYYRRRGADGIGFGDVKLAAAGACLVGTAGFAEALLAASLMALLGVAMLRLRRTACAIDRVAFGAFLAPALWCVWVLRP